jgi:hypothetical protein
MKRSTHMRVTSLAILFLSSISTAFAGEKTLMHCFAWTPIKEATPADWQAFYKTSDDIPKKIKGVTHVWYGKLNSPLPQVMFDNIDNDTFQKYRKGETVPATVKAMPRDYGMCMEMTSESVLKAYDEHPYHKIWTAAYEKVRVDGTTTFNILGQ